MVCFDFAAAFPNLHVDWIWAVLMAMGVHPAILVFFQLLYSNNVGVMVDLAEAPLHWVRVVSAHLPPCKRQDYEEELALLTDLIRQKVPQSSTTLWT